MSVRSFSFASLLAVAAPALAADPAQTAQTAQTAQQAAPAPQEVARIEGRWSFTVADGILLAELTLVNVGNAAADVIVSRGSSPGPYARATIGDAALDLAPTDAQMTDMVSRMGPLPRFAPIPAGEKFVVGTYRFALPRGYKGEPVRIEAEVASERAVQTLVATYAPAGGV